MQRSAPGCLYTRHRVSTIVGDAHPGAVASSQDSAPASRGVRAGQPPRVHARRERLGDRCRRSQRAATDARPPVRPAHLSGRLMAGGSSTGSTRRTGTSGLSTSSPGEHENLTPDGGDCRSAAVSPDAKLIAFMSGRDGFSLMNADGSNRRALSKLGHGTRRRPGPLTARASRSSTSIRPARTPSTWTSTSPPRTARRPRRSSKSAEGPSWSRDGRVLYCIARRKARTRSVRDRRRDAHREEPDVDSGATTRAPSKSLPMARGLRSSRGTPTGNRASCA